MFATDHHQDHHDVPSDSHATDEQRQGDGDRLDLQRDLRHRGQSLTGAGVPVSAVVHRGVSQDILIIPISTKLLEKVREEFRKMHTISFMSF